MILSVLERILRTKYDQNKCDPRKNKQHIMEFRGIPSMCSSTTLKREYPFNPKIITCTHHVHVSKHARMRTGTYSHTDPRAHTPYIGNPLCVTASNHWNSMELLIVLEHDIQTVTSAQSPCCEMRMTRGDKAVLAPIVAASDAEVVDITRTTRSVSNPLRV